MHSTGDVAKKLVELTKAGKNLEAVDSLYSPKIVNIEAQAMPGHPARTEGIENVRSKNKWWVANHTVHSCKVAGPWPHGDQFIVTFAIDVTAKGGPMEGKRFQMEEAALYTVKDGKIVQEEYFYGPCA